MYSGKLKVGNYSDVAFSSEGAAQLASAVNSSAANVECLRFSEKTIRDLDEESIRVFGKTLADTKVIFVYCIQKFVILFQSDANLN